MKPLPYKPGTSPFHVRGSTYVGMQKYVAESVPGGFGAVIAHIRDDDLRAFAQQVFLPVAWYDALPIPSIAEAIAEVERRPMADSVRDRGVIIARRDLGSLYKLMLKVVSPNLVMDRLQRASVRYFDFGHADVLPSRPGRSQARISGFPSPLTVWFIPMLEGYASVLLEAAGAGSPRVRFDPPEREGERMGVETVTLTLHISWT